MFMCSKPRKSGQFVSEISICPLMPMNSSHKEAGEYFLVAYK